MTAQVRPPSPLSGDEVSTGDRAAPTEVNTLVDLYGKHERRIYRYCLSLLRNPDDAEDATQETFTRAAPFLPNLAGDLSAYLTTVARNICCDVVRARARRPVPIDNVPLPDRAVSPERQSVDWDVVRRMWRQLTPSERLLFAYTFAGYRYEEIASRTGMSRPSVSVGLTRARRRLRDLATAIGALGLLPLGLRRLLDRTARRANAALASGQQALLSVAEQVGAIAAGVLAALVGGGVAGPALVATPPMMNMAQHALADGSSVVASQRVDREPPSRAGAPAFGPGAPPPGSAPTTPPLPPAVRQIQSALPGSGATPWTSSPSTMTASPAFDSDHTVFLTADVANGCAGPACAALFRSQDGGASWSRLSLGTYQGGVVLLSPRYPVDPTVFVLDSGVGLLASPTGDGSYTAVVPGATAAAIAPDSPVSSARIAAIVGTTTLATYAMGDSTARMGPVLPPGITGTGLVFAGADRVVVAGQSTDVAAGLSSRPVLVVCSLTGSCGAPVALPVTSDPGIYLAPTYSLATPLIAHNSRAMYLSTDQGLSFHSVLTAPADQLIEVAAVGATPAGSRLVASLSDLATQRRATVRYSDDLGSTFADATGNLNTGGCAMAADVTSTGAMLLGMEAGVGVDFALRESSGNGSWAAPRPS